MPWGKQSVLLGYGLWGNWGSPVALGLPCMERREEGSRLVPCPWAKISGKKEAGTTFLKSHEGDELVRGACGCRPGERHVWEHLSLGASRPVPRSIPRTSIRSIRSCRVRTASSSSRTAGGSSGGWPMVPGRGAARSPAAAGGAAAGGLRRPPSQRLSLPVSSRMVSWSMRIRSFCSSAVRRSWAAALRSASSSSGPAALPAAVPVPVPVAGHSVLSGVQTKRLKSGGPPGRRGPALASASAGPCSAPSPLSAAGRRAAAAESLSAAAAGAAVPAGWTLAMMQMMAPRKASMPAASSTARNFRVAAAWGARARGRRENKAGGDGEGDGRPEGWTSSPEGAGGEGPYWQQHRRRGPAAPRRAYMCRAAPPAPHRAAPAAAPGPAPAVPLLVTTPPSR